MAACRGSDVESGADRLAGVLDALDADRAVVGVLLIGSRCFAGMPTPRSDYDLMLIVDRPLSDAGQRAWHTPELDIAVVASADWDEYAMPGHREAWNRYALARSRVLRDRLDGEITRTLARKARLSPAEAGRLARGALRAYVNSCHRSLKSLDDGRVVQARLDAVESVPHALTALFAMAERVRPYNKYLLWELEHHPLHELGEAAAGVVEKAMGLLDDSSVTAQHELFGEIELIARRRGLADAIDRFGPTLSGLRQPSARRPTERVRAATERVLGYINRTHGLGYELGEPLAGGFQSGAYLLRDSAGGEAVLKWSADRRWARQLQRAAPVIERARSQGWPTPAWLASGATPSGYPYQVQERAPGVAHSIVTAELVEAVLPVIDWQRGRSPQTEQDWSAHARTVVFDERSGALASIERFSPEGAALAQVLRSSVAPFRDARMSAGDLVHGDMNPQNILLQGGRVSALVDAEAVGKGSRLYDLATLLCHAALWGAEPGAAERLGDYARAHAAAGEFAVSLAACLADILAFQVRHHPGDANPLLNAGADVLHRWIAALLWARSAPVYPSGDGVCLRPSTG